MFLALNDGIKQSDFYLMTDISLENINLKRRELDVKKPIKQVNIFILDVSMYQMLYGNCSASITSKRSTRVVLNGVLLFLSYKLP